MVLVQLPAQILGGVRVWIVGLTVPHCQAASSFVDVVAIAHLVIALYLVSPPAVGSIQVFDDKVPSHDAKTQSSLPLNLAVASSLTFTAGHSAAISFSVKVHVAFPRAVAFLA